MPAGDGQGGDWKRALFQLLVMYLYKFTLKSKLSSSTIFIKTTSKFYTAHLVMKQRRKNPFCFCDWLLPTFWCFALWDIVNKVDWSDEYRKNFQNMTLITILQIFQMLHFVQISTQYNSISIIAGDLSPQIQSLSKNSCRLSF